MAGELIATGVSFSIGDAALTEVFTVVPGVTSVDFPAPETPEINVSALDSTAAEFLVGLAESGEFTVSMNVRKPATGTGYIAAQNTLENYGGDGILRGWRIIVKDGATTLKTYSGKGYVRSFKPGGINGPNTQLTAVATIRVSGAVTRV